MSGGIDRFKSGEAMNVTPPQPASNGTIAAITVQDCSRVRISMSGLLSLKGALALEVEVRPNSAVIGGARRFGQLLQRLDRAATELVNAKHAAPLDPGLLEGIAQRLGDEQVIDLLILLVMVGPAIRG